MMRWPSVSLIVFTLAASASASACRKDTGDGSSTKPASAAASVAASAQPSTASGATQQLTVTSSALAPGKAMPKTYACNDEKHRDVSPPLAWTKGPEGTEYYAVEMLDLDAPKVKNDWDKDTKNFLHWRVINVPATVLSFPESRTGTPPPSAGFGIENDFGTPTYAGPCPPPGSPPHRYAITVYAMKKKQAVNLSIPRAEALASGTLTVTYAR